ncbi:hypothetical protein ACIQV3_38575 [Streptomyces sp. NPDC099050]|uniref:hypothetical protein n=1 Tax=Streptomyces sp. NPDC099050 TaxID=3366100 RepID=UPI0038271704
MVFKEASRVTGRCATTGSTGADIREVFCDRVNFYATPELAGAAAAADPDLAVCSVDEGWAIGKRLADLF